MPAFFAYLRNITYYLLFASMVGLVAPAGKYKKFVSLVMGLVLLALMVQPLGALFGSHGLPVTEWFSGLVAAESPQEDGTYQAWRDAHLTAAFHDQLSAQLEGLLGANGITIHEAGFTHAEDFSRITSVWVRVSRKDEEERRVPFIRIEPVQITRPEETEENPLKAEVRNLISGFYNLPDTHIHVEIYM